MTNRAAPTRIMLADDHGLVRAGIRSLLEQLPDVQVVAEARDGRQVLETLGPSQTNVLLLDIGLPVLNGIEVARRVAQHMPHVKVIVLSMHSDEAYVVQALRAGVSGYLVKDSATAELAVAIQAVGRGDVYLSPAISRNLIKRCLEIAESDEEPAEELTSRQREILQLIAEGKSTKEIAFALELSVKTIETHRADIMDRLNIHDVAGLVRYAIRIGLTSADA